MLVNTCMCLSSNQEYGGGSPTDVGLIEVLPVSSSFSGSVWMCSTNTESAFNYYEGKRNRGVDKGERIVQCKVSSLWRCPDRERVLYVSCSNCCIMSSFTWT